MKQSRENKKKERENERTGKKTPLTRRIFAGLLVLVMVALILLAVIAGVKGSRYFMPLVFTAIALPVICYLFVWIRNVFRS